MKALTPIDGAVALSHWGVIRARGDEAAKFLHSQLTNDFTAMALSEARLAGYCSAKGRLLASFVAWKAAHDEVLLACDAEVLPAVLKRLSMFVLRTRCKLSDASAELRLFGLVGASALAWLGPDAPAAAWEVREHDGTRVIRLPEALDTPRFLAAVPAEAAPPSLPSLDLPLWRWLEIHSGVASIESATVERFVPQMLNFELVGGVNFQKGCYPGQEVVARSQYRGSIKRRTFVFDTDVQAAAGQEVFHSGDPGQPCGMVVNAAPRPGGGGSALVEIKLAALEGGSLHLGSPGGPVLQRGALPYAVPSEAAASA